MARKAKIGVLGASGYTGSECVRLLLRHPQVEIALLTADRRAGQEMRDVFPQFSPYGLPKLVPLDGIDWAFVGVGLHRRSDFRASPPQARICSDCFNEASKVEVNFPIIS